MWSLWRENRDLSYLPTGFFCYTAGHMSPLGIKRTVAIVLILSPWIFIPGIFKDIVFVIAGVLLFIGTLDLRKKLVSNLQNTENESIPVTQNTVNS